VNSREAEVFEEDQKRRSTPRRSPLRLTPKEREAALLIAKHYLDLNRTLVSGDEVLLVMRALRDAENTVSETKEPTREWLIWSNEHRAWWGPNNAGYPKDVHKAGRYTLAEARSICSSRSWDAHGVPPETMIHEIEATRV